MSAHMKQLQALSFLVSKGIQIAACSSFIQPLNVLAALSSKVTIFQTQPNQTETNQTETK